MHGATMGNMLVCHGRRGGRTRTDGQTGFGFAQAGRKKNGRGMLGALCWNFLVAETQVFLPYANLSSEKT